jgi:glycosyltransferase involved in cell wall biosynthesis
MLEGGRRVLGLESHNRKGQPRLSVITVSFNSRAALEKTLASVVSQTYANIEYIVVDGGSDDGTIELLRGHNEAIEYWVSERDGGIYDAMNKGVARARGDYVGIIGAGDWYEPGAFQAIARVISKTPAGVIYGDVQIEDTESGLSHFRRSRAGQLPRTMSAIGHQSVFVQRSMFGSQPFDTSFRIAADYDFCLRLHVRGVTFAHSGALIAHIIGGGISATAATRPEVFRVHRKYYGWPYAAFRYVITAGRIRLQEVRRKLLESLLPPKVFAMARSIWWRHKGRRTEP